MAHHASASKAELLLACQWWAHPSRVLDRTTSQAAAAGTDNHIELAAAASGLDAPDWAQAAVLDVPQDAMVEVSLALDVYTGEGRLLGTEGRSYGGIDDTEIPGTADLAWEAKRWLWVRDWKTGQNARDTTTEAKDNAQLAVLALAAIHEHDSRCDEPIERVTLQLAFVGPGRELELDEYETTPEELRARWMPQLRDALSMVPSAEPRPNSGCHWCPALSSCPAANVQLATVERASAMAEEAILTTAITSPEHAASVHARLRLVDAMAEKIGAALKEYVRANGPVPLGGGKVLRICETSRETCALSRVPADLRPALQECGAISVSMSDSLRVGSAEPRKRAKKEKQS